jgi:hypothetical protein
MILNQFGQPMQPRNQCKLGLGLGLGFGSKQPPSGGGGASLLSATIDYTGVGDTTDYTHPDTTELGINNGHDVVSGRFSQEDNNTESAFFIKQSVLDLSGKTTVSVKFTSYTNDDTSSSYGALILSDDFTPGNVTVVNGGSLTGYKLSIGSGGDVYLYRVVAGSATEIATRTPSGVTGVTLEMRVTIGGPNNTIQIFEGESQLGADVTDSDAGRATDLPCAAFALRNFFNDGGSFETFVASEVA